MSYPKFNVGEIIAFRYEKHLLVTNLQFVTHIKAICNRR